MTAACQCKKDCERSKVIEMKKRVVVTGMGAITPIGNSVDAFWEGIKQEKIGFDKIS